MRTVRDLVEVFKALSNSNRMRIYRTIRIRIVEHHDSSGQEECCVGDICKEFEISPSTVSHHLKELRRAGLISMEREGQFSHISINEDIFSEVRKFFEDMDEDW